MRRSKRLLGKAEAGAKRMYKVKSKTIHVNRRRPRVDLPSLEIRVSKIPQAGLGLFVAQEVKKGALVAEFGGLLVDHSTAEEMREAGQDTHLRSLHPMVDCLDGRTTGTLTVQWYEDNLVVASFANDPFGSTEKGNVVAVVVDVKGHMNPAGFETLRRVFLKASRDLQAGEELLFNYGSGYHKRHFMS